MIVQTKSRGRGKIIKNNKKTNNVASDVPTGDERASSSKNDEREPIRGNTKISDSALVKYSSPNRRPRGGRLPKHLQLSGIVSFNPFLSSSSKEIFRRLNSGLPVKFNKIIDDDEGVFRDLLQTVSIYGQSLKPDLLLCSPSSTNRFIFIDSLRNAIEGPWHIRNIETKVFRNKNYNTIDGGGREGAMDDVFLRRQDVNRRNEKNGSLYPNSLEVGRVEDGNSSSNRVKEASKVIQNMRSQIADSSPALSLLDAVEAVRDWKTNRLFFKVHLCTVVAAPPPDDFPSASIASPEDSSGSSEFLDSDFKRNPKNPMNSDPRFAHWGKPEGELLTAEKLGKEDMEARLKALLRSSALFRSWMAKTFSTVFPTEDPSNNGIQSTPGISSSIQNKKIPTNEIQDDSNRRSSDDKDDVSSKQSTTEPVSLWTRTVMKILDPIKQWVLNDVVLRRLSRRIPVPMMLSHHLHLHPPPYATGETGRTTSFEMTNPDMSTESSTTEVCPYSAVRMSLEWGGGDGALLPLRWRVEGVDSIIVQLAGRRRCILIPPSFFIPSSSSPSATPSPPFPAPSPSPSPSFDPPPPSPHSDPLFTSSPAGLFPAPTLSPLDGYSLPGLAWSLVMETPGIDREAAAAFLDSKRKPWADFFKMKGQSTILSPGDSLFVPAGYFLHSELLHLEEADEDPDQIEGNEGGFPPKNSDGGPEDDVPGINREGRGKSRDEDESAEGDNNGFINTSTHPHPHDLEAIGKLYGDDGTLDSVRRSTWTSQTRRATTTLGSRSDLASKSGSKLDLGSRKSNIGSGSIGECRRDPNNNSTVTKGKGGGLVMANIGKKQTEHNVAVIVDLVVDPESDMIRIPAQGFRELQLSRTVEAAFLDAGAIPSALADVIEAAARSYERATCISHDHAAKIPSMNPVNGPNHEDGFLNSGSSAAEKNRDNFNEDNLSKDPDFIFDPETQKGRAMRRARDIAAFTISRICNQSPSPDTDSSYSCSASTVSPFPSSPPCSASSPPSSPFTLSTKSVAPFFRSMAWGRFEPLDWIDKLSMDPILRSEKRLWYDDRRGALERAYPELFRFQIQAQNLVSKSETLRDALDPASFAPRLTGRRSKEGDDLRLTGRVLGSDGGGGELVNEGISKQGNQ